MILVQQPDPCDNWDWIYEIKHDGFRGLAVIEHGQCRFFSRKKHKLTGHQDLRTALVKEVHVETAILDGELVVTEGGFDETSIARTKETTEMDLAVAVSPCPLCRPAVMALRSIV